MQNLTVFLNCIFLTEPHSRNDVSYVLGEANNLFLLHTCHKSCWHSLQHELLSLHVEDTKKVEIHDGLVSLYQWYGMPWIGCSFNLYQAIKDSTGSKQLQRICRRYSRKVVILSRSVQAGGKGALERCNDPCCVLNSVFLTNQKGPTSRSGRTLQKTCHLKQETNSSNLSVVPRNLAWSPNVTLTCSCRTKLFPLYYCSDILYFINPKCFSSDCAASKFTLSTSNSTGSGGTSPWQSNK